MSARPATHRTCNRAAPRCRMNPCAHAARRADGPWQARTQSEHGDDILLPGSQLTQPGLSAVVAAMQHQAVLAPNTVPGEASAWAALAGSQPMRRQNTDPDTRRQRRRVSPLVDFASCLTARLRQRPLKNVENHEKRLGGNRDVQSTETYKNMIY